MKRTREKEPPLNQKNSAKEPNKKKHRLTLDQSEIMQDFYLNTSQYPTPEQYTGLANQLKIDKAKVKNWFHNRRARDRKSENSVPSKLDHFKSIEYPSPKYEYSGELLFRMLALRATEAVKRDIKMKTSSLKSASFDFNGCSIFNERTPLQNNGNLFREQVVHCRESSSGDFSFNGNLFREQVVHCRESSSGDFSFNGNLFREQDVHCRESFNGDCPIDDSIPDLETLCCNLYSSDLHVEYLNCLYPLLSGN